MKVLSLLQPWATLVVIGAKKIETRNWKTKHRGPLLIHASLGWSKKQQALGRNKFFYDALCPHSSIYDDSVIEKAWGLPLGAIIGQVNVIGVYESTHFPMTRTVMPNYLKDGKLYHIPFTEQEEAFGDYSPGRWGWLLSDAFKFDTPIPISGHRGLWDFVDVRGTPLTP